MRKSNLIRAITLGSLLSLSSACVTNQMRSQEVEYSNPNPEIILEQETEEPIIQEEKSNLRKTGEFVIEYTVRGLSIAQYWIL